MAYFTKRYHLPCTAPGTLPQRDSVTWVHVEGHPTESALYELGRAFSLHALTLEDVLNTGQRPKVEAFDDQLFVVLSMPFMVSGRYGVRPG